MSDYNYDSFSAAHYDLDNFKGPVPGQKAPDFALQTTNGSTRNLLDFESDFLVLELGSITCPLFQSRRVAMQTLVDRQPDTSFAILYVREAHPGAIRQQHKSAADKNNNACALQSEDGEGRTILIDTFEGTAHKAYGSFPNAVFIINRNGCILYYSDWNNPRATGKALAALKARKPASGMGVFLPAKPPVALATLKNAGVGAGRDFLRSFPSLVWKNLIKRNLRVLLRHPNPILPDTQC